jgi:hypothetical protein
MGFGGGRSVRFPTDIAILTLRSSSHALPSRLSYSCLISASPVITGAAEPVIAPESRSANGSIVGGCAFILRPRQRESLPTTLSNCPNNDVA